MSAAKRDSDAKIANEPGFTAQQRDARRGATREKKGPDGHLEGRSKACILRNKVDVQCVTLARHASEVALTEVKTIFLLKMSKIDFVGDPKSEHHARRRRKLCPGRNDLAPFDAKTYL